MLLAPVVDIFCDIDDFYKEFSKKQANRALPCLLLIASARHLRPKFGAYLLPAQ